MFNRKTNSHHTPSQLKKKKQKNRHVDELENKQVNNSNHIKNGVLYWKQIKLPTDLQKKKYVEAVFISVFDCGDITDKHASASTLTCPVQRPTTRSAMKVSSVSPERWLTITPQPLVWANLQLKDTGPHKAFYYRQTHLLLSSFYCHKVDPRQTLTPPGTRWRSQSGWPWAAGSYRPSRPRPWRCAWGWWRWGRHPPPGWWCCL